ncbi:TPA_exp: Uncharacterized protein A8136_4657 [Trichophyton benhamiae CBS 112371]|nr:TPA_exp: Uncharacterized protein A8136_4657 [Trichophyton benhamiae CBS 112371]
MSSMQNSDTTNGGEENNPMTIDDMKACYSQADVEDAMFTRNYVEYRNKEIKKLQDDIETAKSSNDVAGVEHFEKCLRDYKAETPSLPPIDPTERGDLDADVLWRIRVLKYQIYPDSSNFLRENINAILNAYRQGQLKLDYDQVTVWFAGRLVYGPVPRKNFDLGAMVMEKGRGFYEKYGPGTLWAEPVAIRTLEFLF